MDLETGQSYLIQHPTEGVMTATFLHEMPTPRQEGDDEAIPQWRFLADDQQISIPVTAVLGRAD